MAESHKECTLAAFRYGLSTWAEQHLYVIASDSPSTVDAQICEVDEYTWTGRDLRTVHTFSLCVKSTQKSEDETG